VCTEGVHSGSKLNLKVTCQYYNYNKLSVFKGIDLFTVSDTILLGGKRGINCSKCMGEVKSLMHNKLRVMLQVFYKLQGKYTHGSVTNVQVCEPEPRTYFCESLCFFFAVFFSFFFEFLI